MVEDKRKQNDSRDLALLVAMPLPRLTRSAVLSFRNKDFVGRASGGQGSSIPAAKLSQSGTNDCPMKTILDLNDDVLSCILSTLETSCLANFRATCRTANAIAMPHLLASVHLDLHRRQGRKFCLFMLDHAPNRVLLLHHLHLSTAVLQARSVPLTGTSFEADLAGVLRLALYLETLELHLTEHLFQAEPGLGKAISQCPRLVNIRFFQVGKLSVQVMMGMRELRQIHTDSLLNITPVLCLFQTTLEVISLVCGDTTTYHFPKFGHQNQWPLLHTFEIIEAKPSVLDRRVLVLAFPNLRRLRIPGLRTEKRCVENEQNDECWPSLNFVEGDVCQLGRMALRCPIRELRVFGVLWPTYNRDVAHWSPELGDTEAFLDLVRTAAPSILSFEVVSVFCMASFYEQLALAVPRLNSLTVTIHKRPFHHVHGDLQKQLVIITKAFTAVPITCFSHHLYASSSDPEMRRAMLMCIVTSIPSVRLVHFRWFKETSPQFQNFKSPFDEWWVVKLDDGNNHKFEKICDGAGRTMQRCYRAQ